MYGLDTPTRERVGVPASMVRAIPPELESINLDCLAKRPEARPQKDDELLAPQDAVQQSRARTPVRSREWWDQFRRFKETQRPAEVRRPALPESMREHS
jgi:hypothetical protein